MSTLDYYNNNAEEYFKKTSEADMSHLYQVFYEFLPKKDGKILDLGCGSGRDSRVFINAGYLVEAIDGSKEMCKKASEYLCRKVRCVDIRTYEPDRRYDGIWACASLLHLSKEELLLVFGKIKNALTEEGVLYCNFKYGSFEGVRDDRYYTDIDEEAFEELITKVGGYEIKKMWTTTDVLPGREEQKWLNVVVGRR